MSPFPKTFNNDDQKALPFWRVVEKAVQFTAAVHHVLHRSGKHDKLHYSMHAGSIFDSQYRVHDWNTFFA